VKSCHLRGVLLALVLCIVAVPSIAAAQTDRPRVLAVHLDNDINPVTQEFVDNAIDRASGTIRGRAVFENPSGVFTPGMFARLRVPGSRPYQALLVPDVAIASEQTRKYVLTVADDGTVQQKYVTLGPAMGHLRVVKEGISADERVIVNGLMRARPGQKVTPQEQGALLGPGRPSAEAGSPRAN